jgi:hypothetical protein
MINDDLDEDLNKIMKGLDKSKSNKEESFIDNERPSILDSTKSEGSILIVYVDRNKIGLMKENQKVIFPIDSEFKIVKTFDYKNEDERINVLTMCAEFIESFENNVECADMRNVGKYYLIEGKPIKIKIKKQIVLE